MLGVLLLLRHIPQGIDSATLEGKKHGCLYVPVGGVCNRTSVVYYYSPLEGDCKKWNGCLGPGFYFSRPRCERACRDAPHGICALEKDEGTFGVPPFGKKYFYNQITQQCEPFEYQGNGEDQSKANRFENERECKVKCERSYRAKNAIKQRHEQGLTWPPDYW
ncbi:hypothetical protein HPB52_000929 [Rhipicephalus sanguineus]|uniref:BPTI/Kunitz inhibitor domain-containing protein n=1 Tax=Rhipicephalus sanguineus TaxID=34632 RepID=A0A9D4PTG9_RHISA|nr:hypothetical protein HPB52_000929 [Rhipicephalus sanguineus]